MRQGAGDMRRLNELVFRRLADEQRQNRRLSRNDLLVAGCITALPQSGVRQRLANTSGAWSARDTQALRDELVWWHQHASADVHIGDHVALAVVAQLLRLSNSDTRRLLENDAPEQ